MEYQVPRKAITVLAESFHVDPAYDFVKELGQGAYGLVCAARNAQTGDSVAIKKVTKIFTKKILTKRALRELKGHKNITCLYDLDIVDVFKFNEVYLYEELMEADLHAIIRSGQPLTDQHFQSFIYQTLCGLLYIHSASVLHRDLKPGNLLVNADCELKICDFGLARGFDMDPNAQNAGFMTEYVATRWYRAPEIMLSFTNYTTAIDLSVAILLFRSVAKVFFMKSWSVGCILAELLGGRPIFKGKDYVDQLNQILHYLGTPSDDTLRRVGSPRAQEYIRSLQFSPGVPFHHLYPKANPLALDLLTKLLSFDPSKRITCREALRHPYLSIWHDSADEIVCPTAFNFSFEQEETTEGMRNMIVEEVRAFRRMVRMPPSQRQGSGPKKQETLPVPSRDEILSSPSGDNMVDDSKQKITASPIDENPAEGFEREIVQRR
ncbi:MAG: Mitogen-activated protein kinase [Cyphobasidiales sp. Tagirdzhanova-0007]|nr:MAG: Mitogen-activated protein kinase [Cyphobasidiales sp. Tagirdzhanova-0007]